MTIAAPRITRLSWTDPDLGPLDLPGGRIAIRAGYGSGLARRQSDPPATVWAVCDRGPNIKLADAVRRFGLAAPAALAGRAGAKLMPRLDLGPALAELRVEEDRVVLVRTLRIASASGEPLPGLPVPGADHDRQEPVFGLSGEPLGSHPAGADTEGVAALAGGGFWVADEYGPSLLRLDPAGRVEQRWFPRCAPVPGGGAAAALLPGIAARRQINRGFEAIALSPDENALWVAFQSPLAHPDEEAHRGARHVRIWRLDASSGDVARQFLYPLDPPETFLRDTARGQVEWGDLKVCEIVAAGPDHLLVLERASQTSKIYRIRPSDGDAVAPRHLDAATRPTIEEMSEEGSLDQPALAKTLLFSSDEAPEVAADLEGMVLLAPDTLLLVSDNDFGVGGAETSFWRLRFDAPVVP